MGKKAKAATSAGKSTTSTDPLTAVDSIPASVSADPTHCPYRRSTDLLQRLAPGKMRIGFFIGAGCSFGIQVPDGAKTKPLIPNIEGLTTQVKELLSNDSVLSKPAQLAWNRLAGRSIDSPTIEHVLSHIRTLKSLCGSDSIDGFSENDLDQLDHSICEHVRKIVSQDLPTTETAYHALANWIRNISRDKPVEIFTTNYDLLMEQALEEHAVPYFDGFVGSDSAFIDLESMAEDDLPARWARLWKIHGSINWWLTAKGKIRRSRAKVEGEQLLIYPSHLKDEQSRQMPFVAMMDRLRVFLRSSQCILLTCGYSFGDSHINRTIAQGLSGNPNSACFAMIFNDRADAPNAVELAKRYSNLTLLAADGAVIGSVERNWHNIVKDDNPAFASAVSNELLDLRTKAPPDQCKWLLGDFASLGKFLSCQLIGRGIENGGIDAY